MTVGERDPMQACISDMEIADGDIGDSGSVYTMETAAYLHRMYVRICIVTAPDVNRTGIVVVGV